jgi:hypothetical protein
MGATPEEPVLFIKPETALCDIRQPLAPPIEFSSVHHALNWPAHLRIRKPSAEKPLPVARWISRWRCIFIAK